MALLMLSVSISPPKDSIYKLNVVKDDGARCLERRRAEPAA